MLYHFPLEPYKERYTMQLSGPDGWLRRNWDAAGIEYQQILGESVDNRITTGSVLNAVGRCKYAMSQIGRFLEKAEAGEISNDDVLYFDDYWHPGIESIPYVLSQLGIRPKMFAMLHAQSIDKYDFTYPMRDWMRPFEQGIGKILDGVFVTNTELGELVREHNIGTPFLAGLPFNSTCVRDMMPDVYTTRRTKKVVFSSRWDAEKQPLFFLSVVDAVLQRDPNVTFVVCTSAARLRSNSKHLIDALDTMMAKWPSNLILREGLTKQEYYNELATSRIQLNTALQDWVSWTLLESTTAGCYPVYPCFRSFPETLAHKAEYLYVPSVSACCEKILSVIDCDSLWSKDAIENREWIYKRFDLSWKRMAHVMGLIEDDGIPSLY